ncbi:MAG: hypothetical protein IJ672_05795 [Methanobrevibacter sp.]|nr:hypothetical protein [Methanobrevibacter sp.]
MFLLFVVLPAVVALLFKDNDTIDVKSLYNYADETFRAKLKELDQEEKDAEACETIDGYDDAMLNIHVRRIDLLKEYGFYA